MCVILCDESIIWLLWVTCHHTYCSGTLIIYYYYVWSWLSVGSLISLKISSVSEQQLQALIIPSLGLVCNEWLAVRASGPFKKNPVWKENCCLVNQENQRKARYLLLLITWIQRVGKHCRLFRGGGGCVCFMCLRIPDLCFFSCIFFHVCFWVRNFWMQSPSVN